ncbi:MAG: alpha/beta hydrolase [Pseudomonadota bacterium]|nr:alpha/beta hydrolase [Pseudomonadota bacterium]
MKTTLRSSILAPTLLAALGLMSNATADQRELKHMHVGGGLSHPPHTMILQVQYSDIVYDTSVPDSHAASLDVYTMDPPEPNAPVMVFVHGGGFRVGDKASSKDLDPKPEYFNSKLGYVFVSVNYRLLPEGKYPTNARDVAKALAWVHDNIARFNGDPNQIFLMGHSAGAALVAQVSTDESLLRSAGKSLDILKGVIANEGTYVWDFDVKRAEAMFGADWRKASPSEHVAKAKGLPPFLLLYVKNASPTSISANSEKNAARFSELLRGAGVRVDAVGLDHVEHFGANERMGEPGDIITSSVENFLSSIASSKRPIGWTAARPLN